MINIIGLLLAITLLFSSFMEYKIKKEGKRIIYKYELITVLFVFVSVLLYVIFEKENSFISKLFFVLSIVSLLSVVFSYLIRVFFRKKQ